MNNPFNMKAPILSLLAIVFMVFYTTDVISQSNTSKHTIIQVIDFHGTRRCMTCNAIEDQTKATLEKYYKKEMDQGLITFQTVNVDDEANSKLAEEFDAAGTSLFINVVKDGKSKKINLTDFAFLNATSKGDSFEKGLKNEIDKALKM